LQRSFHQKHEGGRGTQARQEERQNSVQLEAEGRSSKFSSFRTLGIPRIVGNGEIKNSFLIRKEENLAKKPKKKGGDREEITCLYCTVEDLLMFSLVCDCHIGLPVSLSTSSKEHMLPFRI
jgi:hypothetical protein